MAYSLTYMMWTGQGCRTSDTAADAVVDYAALSLAGASDIVIRDGRCIVVTLASLIVLAKPDRWTSVPAARAWARHFRLPKSLKRVST